MVGWQLVWIFNLITAASYVGIAGFIVNGLIHTHQLRRNQLALATAAIFLTCGAHHVLHALDLLGEGTPQQLSLTRELMGENIDVLVTLSTAVTGVVYLGLRRSYNVLLRSPALFDLPTEARYRQLAANLPHTAVFVVDRDLRFVLVAGSALANTGYDRKVLEGRRVVDVLPPAVYRSIAPRYQAAMAGETIEYDNVSSRTGRLFHNRARPMLDDSGTVVGAMVIAEDVTEERAVAGRLAQAQSFSGAVLAASPDITVVSALPQGQLTWASRSVLEALGWPAGETLADEGPRLVELVLEEDRPLLTRTNEAVALLADGESVTCRFRVRSAGGHRWLSRQSTPFVRDSDGTLLSYLSIVSDITDIVEVELRMEHAALHDPLTGLPNRTLLLDRMSSALARADRLHAEVAVLFCDLDGFKKVNDTDGHAAGDAVLVEVARRLEVLVRRSDSVARVGGDEFVVILEPAAVKTVGPQPTGPDGSAGAGSPDPFLRQVATMVAGRIRAELSRPIEVDGRRYLVSVSIGMTFAPLHSRALDVLRDADIALYRAKQRGKDRVEVFDAALGADVVERARVESVLRDALGQGDIPGTMLGHGDTSGATLIVAYQPVYHLGSRHLVGFEALARLSDPVGAAIGPDAFIPIAEETGLITELGERMLDMALGRLARWHREHAGAPRATMAVNFSARQAQHADMPQVVREALDRHALQSSDLVLELTESVLLESGSSTLRQLTQLRSLGVGIAIDDFGTGYASLRYLASLPVSSVKVDRSFTATMTTNPISATIVRAIISLAKDLDLECVVEGVETAQQLDALPSDVLGQGYLFGRPAPEPVDAWSVPAV